MRKQAEQLATAGPARARPRAGAILGVRRPSCGRTPSGVVLSAAAESLAAATGARLSGTWVSTGERGSARGRAGGHERSRGCRASRLARSRFDFLAGAALALGLVSVLAGSLRVRALRRLSAAGAGARAQRNALPEARVDLGDQGRAWRRFDRCFMALDPRGKAPTSRRKRAGAGLWAGGLQRSGVSAAGRILSISSWCWGLQLQAETGPYQQPKRLCGRRSAAMGFTRKRPTPAAQLKEGRVRGGVTAGRWASVIASRPELVKGLLGMPDIGDRLGFLRAFRARYGTRAAGARSAKPRPLAQRNFRQIPLIAIVIVAPKPA